MTRYLIILAIAAPLVLFGLEWGYRAYGITLNPTGIVLRSIGGVAVSAILAWRISNMLGGKAKPRPARPGPTIYQRPTQDQLASLGGQPAPDTEAEGEAPATLRDRLRQQAPND